MSVFVEIQHNDATGRHELHLVNQQYDLLGVVAWDASAADYQLTAQYPVDPGVVAKALERARRELPELDAKLDSGD